MTTEEKKQKMVNQFEDFFKNIPKNPRLYVLKKGKTPRSDLPPNAVGTADGFIADDEYTTAYSADYHVFKRKSFQIYWDPTNT